MELEAARIGVGIYVNDNLSAGLQAAKTKTDTFAASLDRIGSRMQSVGRTMTRAVTLPIVGGLTAAFNAASNFNESLSKVNVVFGDMAKSVEEWSKTSATSMGISQQAALEAAGTFGNFMQAMGIARKDAAKMSTSLVQLAADLASFNNASPEDVLLALRSGLAGETEPLRKFGVSLSAARVEAEALNMGIDKTYNEMTAAEKASVSYAIILKDTKMAQGDFARTADGAANQMRILKAQLVDSATKIGQKLIPIGLKLLKMVRGWVDAFNNLSPAAQDSLIKILAIAAAVGPLLLIVGKLSTGIGAIVSVAAKAGPALAAAFANPAMLLNPWVLAIAGIAAGALLLIKNWDKVKAFIMPLFQQVAAAAQKLWNDIKEPLTQLWNAMRPILQAIGGLLLKIFGVVARQAVDGLVAAFRLIGPAIAAAAKAFTFLLQTFRGVVNKLLSAWNALDFGIHITIPEWVPLIGGKSFNVGDIFPDVPMLAKGGIVRQATMAIVGEAGPEAVIPLNQLDRMMGAPLTVNVRLDRKRFNRDYDYAARVRGL